MEFCMNYSDKKNRNLQLSLNYSMEDEKAQFLLSDI